MRSAVLILLAAVAAGSRARAETRFTVDPQVGNNTFTAVFDTQIGERITAVSSAVGCTLTVDEEKRDGHASCSVPLETIRVDGDDTKTEHFGQWATNKKTAPKQCTFAPTPPADGAENLRLAPGLSFTDDASDSFPIRGDHVDDGESRPGKATVMFFGAAHCWNTNREAERLVTLYPKYRDRVSFVIVDVNRISPSQRALVETYYHGSIPTVVIVARRGAVLYSQAGETARTRGDARALDSLIARAVDE